MKEETSQQSVPMHVWLKAIFMTILTLSIGFWLYVQRERDLRDNPPDNSVYDFLSTNVKAESQALDVMIFGSSLTKCAFTRYKSLENAFVEEPRIFNYEIITRNSVILDEYSAKIPDILKKKPKYLLLESNMICVQMFKRERQTNYSYRAMFKRYSLGLMSMQQMFKARLWKSFEQLSLPVPPQKLKNPRRFWQSYQKQAKNYKVRSVDDFPEWNSFFLQARENNIQISIIELSRSVDAAHLLPVGFQKDYEALLEQFEKEYGVKNIRFPEVLTQQENYRDAAHLNRKGAKMYSEWFIDLMIDKLNKVEE